MTIYAILDIETDMIFGTYSRLGIVKIVKGALEKRYESRTRFSIIAFEYITEESE